MKFKYFVLFLSVVLLSNCSKEKIQNEKRWCLEEAEEWLSLVRNDLDTESRVQSSVAIEMARAGMGLEALKVAGLIQNYQRAITFGKIGQLAYQKKNSLLAKEALEKAVFSLSFGVGFQRDLGIVEVLDLATRLNRKDVVEKWLKQITTDESRNRANSRISFHQLAAPQIAQVVQIKADEEAKLHQGQQDKHGTASVLAAPNITVEEIFSALEQSWNRGDRANVDTWLQVARARIPDVPSVDRVGYWVSLCHWEIVTGKLDWAQIDLPKAQVELDRISGVNDFKYLWVIQLAGAYKKLGETSRAKDLLEKESLAVKKYVPPYYQMDVLGRMAESAVDSGLGEQATDWWSTAFAEAEKNPNPRSKAVGVIEYLLSHARAGIKPDATTLSKIAKMKAEIPDAYAKLYGFQSK